MCVLAFRGLTIWWSVRETLHRLHEQLPRGYNGFQHHGGPSEGPLKPPEYRSNDVYQWV